MNHEHTSNDVSATTAAPSTDAESGQVSGDAAEVYEAFFVPALFGQFPELVLDHAAVEVGGSVLDVGCGTGVLAAAAASRVGVGGRVVGIDPNDAMLAVAGRRADRVEWRRGVAEDLPFADATFDHVVTQFAAMFFVDPATAVGEMVRVAKPAGSITVVTWAALDRSPGYDAMVRLVDDEIGPEAADALRAPFSIGTLGELEALVSVVDGPVTLDVLDGTARFGSLDDWVHTDIRGWTLADMVDDDAEDRLLARARRDLASFVTSDGRVEFPAPALVATVKPVG